VVLGLLVAGYGLAGSYVTISALAARHDVPLPGLVPVGIDGGLVAVVVLDLGQVAGVGLNGWCLASVVHRRGCPHLPSEHRGQGRLAWTGLRQDARVR
jgi:hypothetical protein